MEGRQHLPLAIKSEPWSNYHPSGPRHMLWTWHREASLMNVCSELESFRLRWNTCFWKQSSGSPDLQQLTRIGQIAQLKISCTGNVTESFMNWDFYLNEVGRICKSPWAQRKKTSRFSSFLSISLSPCLPERQNTFSTSEVPLEKAPEPSWGGRG